MSLTALSSGAGCGCKLAAAELLPIVRALPSDDNGRLLVGAETCDDAAVFEIAEDLALVQTIDFFTPLVDDPYDFGRIAAANALSDVYAMGGTPLTAMNVVAFPLEELGGEVLREILRGGLDIVRRAGATIVGGHSIRDAEPKYGLAVTGVVDPRRLTTNDAGHPGDVLVLTKPLGTGGIVTASKHGEVAVDLLQQAVDVMVTLNDVAAADAQRLGARAMTDVTGYGLLGHLHHLCRESGLAATVDSEAVPTITGVDELLADCKGVSAGSRRNAAWTSEFTSFDPAVEPWRRLLLADATTSGGLLVAISPENAPALAGSVVGRLVSGPAGAISVN